MELHPQSRLYLKVEAEKWKWEYVYGEQKNYYVREKEYQTAIHDFIFPLIAMCVFGSDLREARRAQIWLENYWRDNPARETKALHDLNRIVDAVKSEEAKCEEAEREQANLDTDLLKISERADLDREREVFVDWEQDEFAFHEDELAKRNSTGFW